MTKSAGINRFVKSERLNSKKRIDSLFRKGKSKWQGSLSIKYLFSDEILDAQVQVMFSVPKKQFRRAADRNLLKRRMREAYRLNKHDLFEKVKTDNIYLLVAFIYVGKTIKDYSIIESDLKGLLVKVLKAVN
jgi:ribonuclease P protein component